MQNCVANCLRRARGRALQALDPARTEAGRLLPGEAAAESIETCAQILQCHNRPGELRAEEQRVHRHCGVKAPHLGGEVDRVCKRREDARPQRRGIRRRTE